MDGTIVIAAIIILTIAIVIILLNQSMKRQARNLQKRLTDRRLKLEQANNLTITTMDMYSQKLIGIDNNRNMLIFIDGSNPLIQEKQIPIPEIKRTQIMMRSSKTNTSVPLGTLTQYITAVFVTLIMDSGEEIELPFYSEIQDGVEQRTVLVELAKKWNGIIHPA